MAKPQDIIQITYFRDLSPVMEVVQSGYISDDKDWLYLTSGRYRKSKIKSLRNITMEKAPPEIEDE